MRPYRAIPIGGKDFVYGWLFERAGGSYIIPFTDNYHTPASFVLTFVQVIHETIGQQVGLKDINKKEIYFDDIVLWNEKKYVVVWSKTCLGIYLEHLDSYLARKKDPKKGRFIENLMYGRAVYCKVIGNIHQPELIEEQDNG